TAREPVATAATASAARTLPTRFVRTMTVSSERQDADGHAHAGPQARGLTTRRRSAPAPGRFSDARRSQGKTAAPQKKQRPRCGRCPEDRRRNGYLWPWSWGTLTLAVAVVSRPTSSTTL